MVEEIVTKIMMKELHKLEAMEMKMTASTKQIDDTVSLIKST